MSDALGMATEMKAMKNYAGSRLAPWLGHLMVSRSETARPLLTPGEIMQLPPSDEIVMMSGLHPIRAKKARYYEDRRFQERILAPPALTKPSDCRPDDWSKRPLPPRPTVPPTSTDDTNDAEDPKTADRRQQPELVRDAVERREPLDNEFASDFADELEEDAPRIGRLNDMMQGVARQASLDQGDDLGL
ncbi:type IV secretory pathway TraG/TraD family ATPase VirD4 [Bradyrhizobium sp. USDA 4341]